MQRPRPDFAARADLPIALVVGAGGMSMAIAQRLGQSHRIMLASLKPDELELGQERLHELGVVSMGIVCDITNPLSVQKLGDAVAGRGPLQTLAHVAALSPSLGNWNSVLSVNLIGATRIEETVQPLMAPGGAAVFISSLAAHGPEPDTNILAILDYPLAEDFLPRLEAAISGPPNPGLAYSLSKLALNRMVRRRALIWGKRGTRILSLSPGLIDTVMGAIEDTQASSAAKAGMRRKLPLGRDGSMADIADAVEFLTSRRASYISGTDLLVDGGLAAALLHAGEELR